MGIKRVVCSSIIVVSLVGAASAAIILFTKTSVGALNSGVGMSATISPSSTIEISANNVSLDIVPSINGTFESDYTTVSTYTNTTNTCTITMTTTSTDLTSGNNTIATLSDSVSESEFTNDRWGYRIGSTGNYNAVAASNPIATYTYYTGSTAQETDVYFAAKLTAAVKAGTYTNTVTFISTCVPDLVTDIQELEYMQEFATLTSGEKAVVINSMALNQQYQLKDNRDEKEYYIAKLADGNVWMTQNLDHDIVTTENFYTYANTDIGHGSTPDTSATWTAAKATYDSAHMAWVSSFTTPESFNPGDVCWNGSFGNNNISSGTVACGNDKHYHIGNYYNWPAAVAMNNSSGYMNASVDVEQSICPAGWRLPMGGTANTGAGSFQYLSDQLNFTAGTSGNIQNAPAYFVYAGNFHNGNVNGIGSWGGYWSEVSYDSDEGHSFYFSKSGELSPQIHGTSDVCGSLRCLVR